MIIPEMNKQKVENIVKRHDFSEKVITFRESIPKKSSFPLQEFPPVPPLPPVPQAWWWEKSKLRCRVLPRVRPSIYISLTGKNKSANWQTIFCQLAKDHLQASTKIRQHP